VADLLETGTDWLNGKLKAFASRTVTYVRGAESVSLVVTVAERPLRVSDGVGGVGIVWGNRDYGFEAADLILGGQVAEPRQGDRILETSNGVTRIQEAMTPDGEEAVWRWEDGYHVRRRVHTKKVGTQ